MYRFEVDNRWSYFRDGAPVATSVERGQRKTSFKLKKVYSCQKEKATRRQNAAYNDIESINLVCCYRGCLLKNGIMASKQIIRQERRKVFNKPYNEQNYVMSKLLQVRNFPSGHKKVDYSVPTLGSVCKIAFMKCYGVSPKKIKILLKKVDCDGICIETDMRGRHRNRPQKLTEEARKKVTQFICSHSASKSHYRRARTQKLFFDSRISMRAMWKDFLRQYPDFTSTRLPVKNKGPVISFSSFREIFQQDLSKKLGFRKPREDTCQTCDRNLNAMRRITQESSDNENQELEIIEAQHEQHLKESESRYAALKYDMFVLSRKRESVIASSTHERWRRS